MCQQNGLVFYSTWCNPGMYLAIPFYQPGKKMPSFLAGW